MDESGATEGDERVIAEAWDQFEAAIATIRDVEKKLPGYSEKAGRVFKAATEYVT